MTTLDTEIRKLQPVELCTLAQILNQSDSWKKLMAIVPTDTNGNHYIFNNEHFVMIEQAIRQQQRSGADIFLSEWSTLNKKRPTCRLLLDLLIKANLFRAADYLAVEILKNDPPERPKTGPAAEIDLSEKALEELLNEQIGNFDTKPEAPEDTKTSWSLHFAEKSIDAVGNHFEKINIDQSDLIQFSNDKSDLMKFSDINPNDEAELNNYVLQEAKSEDIPLCVRENAFHTSKIMFSATESEESLTSTESSNFTNSAISREQALENVIPIVVIEYNDKDKKTGDT